MSAPGRTRPTSSGTTASSTTASGTARPDRTKRRPARPPRRVLGLRLRTVAALVVVLVVALGAVAWFSPLLSVREVQVTGTAAVPPEEVVALVDVPVGTPLLQVDLGAAARRVAAQPRVATATVSLALPSGLAVQVLERVAVAYVDAPDGPHLVDVTGADFAAEAPAPGLPRLVVDAPGPDDPATDAALAVLAELPRTLREQVAEVAAPAPDEVSLTLRDGRRLIWGDASRTPRKAAVVAALLTQPGGTFDVSSPELPTAS